MSRSSLFALAVFVIFSAPSALCAQSVRLNDLQRQADDAYCSRNFSKAIELSKSALELVKSDPAANPEKVAEQLDRLAGAAEKQRDFASAEKYYAEQLTVREQQFGKDSLNSAFVMEALARMQTENGKVDEADALYRRVIAARRQSWANFGAQSNIELPDVFKSRHEANAARIALKRKHWRAAFDNYRNAIQSIDESTSEMGTGDDLADLSTEMNSSTFAGLAQAAWELSKVPGENADALMAQSFEALQYKWRTAAALALQKAADRVKARAPGGATSATVREAQDRQERLRSLQAELEDHMQAWFAKRDADPAYSAGTESLLDADREYMAMSPEDQNKINDLLGKMWAECFKQKPPCNVEMNDAMARFKGVAPDKSKSAGRNVTMADDLYAREKQLPGYEEYQRKRIELEIKIGQLNGSGPINQLSPEPAQPKPTSRPSSKSDLGALKVPDVQSLLHDDEVLLTYLVGDNEGFVWAITRDGAMWSPIPVDAAYLEDAVNNLRVGLEPPASGGPAPSTDTKRVPYPLSLAHELYRKLFAPVETLTAGKRHLLIVPTGPLTSLPFQVLVTEAPDPSLAELDGYRKAKWLTRQYALSTLPGVAALKSLRADIVKRPHAAVSFVGFGNPNFDRKVQPARSEAVDVLNTVARCSRSKFTAARELPKLGDTRKELIDVGTALGVPQSEIYLGPSATEARVKALDDAGTLANYRILYFATHGLVTGEVDGLLEPALALTIPEAPSATDDGLLTATEVTQLNLNADWVILSACNTSNARRPGEETLSGLARAFLYAGARALLVSHWPTDSYAARMLSAGTFRTLAENPAIGRAEALRLTMLDMIDNGAPIAAHPSYWAPFVVVGDGMN